MKNLLAYLKKMWKGITLYAFCQAITAAVLFLYEISPEPFCYEFIICTLTGLGALLGGYFCFLKKQKNLVRILENAPVDVVKLPEVKDRTEELYQEIIQKLEVLRMEAENSKMRFYGELTDYYTMWVHQIKTPISALRLILQEDPESSREALTELFKIEQYVEMVLGYLRTEDMSSDMEIRTCSLDAVIREQIHRYAGIFVSRKLALEYQGTEEKVLSDPKWLGFVIGQVLSNALKYTKSGKISIRLCEERPHTLVIEDTGIGIRKDDLPRVFERGFTGCNGRGESHSTGIGLYLCAKIMKKLGHKIYLESEVGKGTEVFLSLGKKEMELYS